MCEVLEVPWKRKERWLYLRAALSSTMSVQKISIYIHSLFYTDLYSNFIVLIALVGL